MADIEELEEKMDASELHARRLNAKEVLTPMKGERFIFPIADGTVKTSGGDRRLRPSTFIRDRPERGEEQEVFRGELDELSSPTLLQDDSARDYAEATNDFCLSREISIYRHHVESRVKLYVLRTESNQFHGSTSTLPEQHLRRWMHCWKNILMIAGTWMEKENYQMHGQASQDSFCRPKGHLTDIHGPGGDLRGNKQPQDPTMYDQICGSICLMQQKTKRSYNAL